MASPPLLLLLLPLLLLPPPAAPGTRGQPFSPAGAGPAWPTDSSPGRKLPPSPTSPPERRGPASPGHRQTAPAPGAAKRPGPSSRAPRSGSAAVVKNHWLEGNTEPQIENITFYQNQVDFSTVISKEGVMVQTPRKIHPSLDAPENITLQTETAAARGINDSSGRTEFTVPHYGPGRTTTLTSQSSTLALGKRHPPSSSSGSEARTAPLYMESGTSWGSPAGAQGLPEEVTVHTQMAATSVLSQSSLPAVEGGEETALPRQRSSSGPEPSWPPLSRTSAYSPPSDHPSSSGSTEDLNNSTAVHSSSVSGTESVHVATTFPNSVQRTPQSSATSLRPLNETEHFPEDSEIAITSSSVHSSPSEAELRRSSGVFGSPGNGAFTELSTEIAFGPTSSNISREFWQNDSPTTEDSPELGVGTKAEEGASWGVPGVRTHSPHTSATFAGVGERTLRSLTNRSTTSGDVERSMATTGEMESATQQGNMTVTGDARPVSGSLAATRTFGGHGVTGISYDGASSTDPDCRTSSEHTNYTCASSPFTKGERTLLSITDNSSSWDGRETSTSSVKISSSLSSDSSPSSQAQTERSNVSSHQGEHAQPSTGALVLSTASSPSHTPTLNTLTTLVPRDTDAKSVGGALSSSSSEPPLPLPSVSQSYQFSSTLPSAGASTHRLQSSPDAPTPLSSSPPPSSVSLTASAPASLSDSQTALPHAPFTPILPRTRDAPVTSVRMSAVASSIPSSQTADPPKNQSSPYLKNTVTESKPPSLQTLPAEATKAVTVMSTLGIPSPRPFTDYSTSTDTEQTLPATSTDLAHTSPALAATTPETSHSPVASPSLQSSTAALTGGPTTGQTVARETEQTVVQLSPTSPEILVVQVTTEGAVTTEESPVDRDAATRSFPLTKESTTGPGPIEDNSLASPFLKTSPSPRTTPVSTAKVLTPPSTTSTVRSSTRSPTAPSSPAAVNSCTTHPCLHDGKCVVDPTTHPGYRCVCSPAWQGDNCSVDVNECLSNPCPPLATCNNTQGSFTCRCPVGYQLEKGICNLVRTFVTEFKLKKTFLNTTVEKHSDLREVENEITKMLNVCFSTLPGYTRSTAHVSRESSVVVMSLQATFSLASNVTLFDLADRMQKCVNSCWASAEVCQLLGSQRRIFRAGSLCKRKTPECDKETSICTDLDGVALCQCKSGYFQFNKMDHSCRACEDGYRLENETCMSCPFGLGGLNCGNPYQLITVVIAAAGGGLLLILGIALIVTCCRKNKNDISKLIFKSGDFQMSPYAEYPKNPRSQEWGREAIEMHENGSTKNLLQMTDVYYSPSSVRNPELERNGLYPAYTGLPGSRHSCIFPGQYNPSFISDESRRRDYF
ncbi:protein HEG homolog 1 isoform X2 [Bos mutus]|uniref:protein HEG homolog 1 isoform X2 n=1 Tax=Bos mutus TaxID=72004 RepID=UPI0038B66DAC